MGHNKHTETHDPFWQSQQVDHKRNWQIILTKSARKLQA